MVIRGGLAEQDAAAVGEPRPEDVASEARRRVKAAGFDNLHTRYLATGVPVPAAVRYLVLQINYTAEALAGLNPIPADFRSDAYWPR
ncbi:hypothetical protein LJR030_000382 [Rhizobium sp. LjRoot30]|uniref:hypothetical protein n=1 Tax=Rhizobium sp. LjRoot30 TaxID=3342320 RepID=UPI003ECD7FEC